MTIALQSDFSWPLLCSVLYKQLKGCPARLRLAAQGSSGSVFLFWLLEKKDLGGRNLTR